MNELFNGIRKCKRMAKRYEQAGWVVLEDLRDSAGIRANNGNTRAHRLHEDERRRFSECMCKTSSMLISEARKPKRRDERTQTKPEPKAICALSWLPDAIIVVHHPPVMAASPPVVQKELKASQIGRQAHFAVLNTTRYFSPSPLPLDGQAHHRPQARRRRAGRDPESVSRNGPLR